ncbi:MAG TPA: protein kinase [Ktedonobacterales bacterium]|jgi:serine/threonine protein kinase
MAGLEGARLGAYELIERVGSGGMAEVYRAKQSTAFGREVAVKVIRQGYSEDKMFRERFLREAQAIAKLSHPNILPLIEFGEENDLLYLVMPYAPDGTLRDLIARVNGPLPLSDATEIFTQLCDAVQYAHEQGIVHRDIKPQNVLIQRGKHLLLADFGIARDASSDQKLTSTGAGVGTVEYMAPEQAMGKSDARSDLYSLGIVLYQMLTGRVPFSGSTPFEIMMKQAQDALQPARSLNPSLPREADGVLAMALAKDPDRRFQSASALLRAVQGLTQAGQGSQVDLSTRAAPTPRQIGAEGYGFPSSPSRGSNPGAGYGSNPGVGYGSNPGRGAPPTWGDIPSRPRHRAGERDPYSSYGDNRPSAGRGSRPYNAPPDPYNDYSDDRTVAAPPPRRPTNPYGGSPSRSGTRPPGVARPEWPPDNAPNRSSNRWLLIVAAVLVVAALAVGGLAYVNLHTGTGAAPITAATNTPASTVTVTPTTPPVLKPSYAFMRDYQVFVSLHGQAPQQMTNIPQVGQPNSFLNAGVNYDYPLTPLLFSPDGRYIAALIAVVTGPSDGFYFGNLYVIDTQTSAVTTPNSPGSSKLITALGGANSIAWADNHTLLISGDENNASILAYDAASGKAKVAFSPNGGAIPVGSVVVRGHFAFYSELVSKSASSYDLILRQYDLNAHSDKKLFTLGTAQALEGPGPQFTGYAPFDISPDGTRILWHGRRPGGSSDGIWYSKLNQTSLFHLFSGVDLGQNSDNLPFQPTPLLSPDGKKALLTTANAVYTINVDGSGIKTYAYPNAQASWLPNSSGITIAQPTSSTVPSYKTFTCALSNGGCSAFQDNGGPLYWSPV